nr:hypothetical protein Iba_chr11cCG10300 [Ipomoea batatas]
MRQGWNISLAEENQNRKSPMFSRITMYVKKTSIGVELSPTCPIDCMSSFFIAAMAAIAGTEVTAGGELLFRRLLMPLEEAQTSLE